MRTKPFLGGRPWFGPRSFGWGWVPISWQGWVAVVVGILLISEAEAELDGAVKDLAVLLSVGALVALCIAKGTAPGGGLGLRRKSGVPRGGDRHSHGTWSIEPGPRKVL